MGVVSIKNSHKNSPYIKRNLCRVGLRKFFIPDVIFPMLKNAFASRHVLSAAEKE